MLLSVPRSPDRRKLGRADQWLSGRRAGAIRRTCYSAKDPEQVAGADLS
jgi:hypothetical protein